MRKSAGNKNNRKNLENGISRKRRGSIFVTGFLAVGIFAGSTEVWAAPQERTELVAYAKVETCLNIRTGAGTQHRIVARLPKDGCCRVLEKQGDWCRIVSEDVEGYVYSKYLLTGVTEREYLALTQRKEPLYAYKIEREETEAEPAGTVSAETSAAVRTKGRTVADFALQFVGNPYVWGGTSLTEGADCSGFVQSVYQNFGVSLPRVAEAQSQVGTRIPVEEAEPGDLIFYARGGSIYHVVLYIGNGQVVHASSAATGIKVSNLYWDNAVWAVRVL